MEKKGRLGEENSWNYPDRPSCTPTTQRIQISYALPEDTLTNLISMAAREVAKFQVVFDQIRGRGFFLMKLGSFHRRAAQAPPLS